MSKKNSLERKKLKRQERQHRKQLALTNIPSYGYERPSKKVANNIMYLYSNGLINV